MADVVPVGGRLCQYKCANNRHEAYLLGKDRVLTLRTCQYQRYMNVRTVGTYSAVYHIPYATSTHIRSRSIRALLQSICLLESNGHMWQGSLETVQLDVRAILAGTLTGGPVVTSADGEVSI